MNRPGRVAAFEGLRGYAAFLVFLVHAFGYLAARLYGLPETDHWRGVHGAGARIAAWLWFSNYGVDLFFVLSGFLMADVALGRWPGTVRFLAHRWLRIYPAYAVSSLALGALIYATTGSVLGGADFWGNVFVLHGFFVLGLVAANPVTWSLSYEVVFYAFVPLLAWRLRGRRPLPGLAWFLPLALAYATLVAVSLALPQPKAIYLAYFALFLPGVALGGLAPDVRARIAERTPFLLVACAWIGFTVAVKLEWVSNLQPLYYPLSSLACALVLLKACDERHAFARWLATPALCRLGKISYSFFLIHYAVVHVYGGQLADAIGLAHRLRFTLLFVPGAFVLSVLAAALLYLAAERFYFRLPAVAQPAQRASSRVKSGTGHPAP